MDVGARPRGLGSGNRSGATTLAVPHLSIARVRRRHCDLRNRPPGALMDQTPFANASIQDTAT